MRPLAGRAAVLVPQPEDLLGCSTMPKIAPSQRLFHLVHVIGTQVRLSGFGWLGLGFGRSLVLRVSLSNESLQRTAGFRFCLFVAQWPAAAEFGVLPVTPVGYSAPGVAVYDNVESHLRAAVVAVDFPVFCRWADYRQHRP